MSVGPPTPPGGSGVSDEGFFTGMPVPPPVPTVSETESSAQVPATPDTDVTTEQGISVTTPPSSEDEGSILPPFEPTPVVEDDVDDAAVLSIWPRLTEPKPEPTAPEPYAEAGYEDREAYEADRAMAFKIYSATPHELAELIAAEPGPQHRYIDPLKAIVHVPAVKHAYDREMATRAMELAITAQVSGDLMDAFERAMEIDQAEILDRVTDDDYDEFDRVVIGNREQDIKLVGEGHMVRILATKKAGKTTNILEIMRCSVTGENPFGVFEIQPIAEDETILFIDPELSSRDYEVYVKQAFTGMSRDEVNRIKRFSTRNQNEAVDPDSTEPRPTPAVFDLSSEATRDVLIAVCNRFKVARIFFDSYIKLIPGSMNKDDDVKRMLANWATIQASTGVRESFWVGHVNNSGEIRSSGSMLLDGTFESLLAITIDATDRRFFQAQAGRMTDAMEPKEILLDPETNRPVIMLDGGAVPVPLDAPNTPGSKPTRTAKGGVGAEELAAQTDAVTRIILTLMGRVGPTALKSGALRRGGFAKEDLSREVLTQWTTFARFIPPTTKTAVITVIGEMIAKRLILSEHPVSGVKKLWLSESGEAKYAELGDGA